MSEYTPFADSPDAADVAKRLIANALARSLAAVTFSITQEKGEHTYNPFCGCPECSRPLNAEELQAAADFKARKDAEAKAAKRDAWLLSMWQTTDCASDTFSEFKESWNWLDEHRDDEPSGLMRYHESMVGA